MLVLLSHSLVILLSGGEPLLHPRFFDIVKELKNYDVFVSVEANATLITDETITKFKEVGIDYVVVSLHGLTPSVHDAIVGMKGAYERVINALRKLISNNIETHVNCVITKLNINELSALIEQLLSMGVEKVYLNEIVPYGRAYKNYDKLILSHQELAKLKSILHTRFKDSINKRVYLSIDTMEMLRQRLLSDFPPMNLVVTVDGRVRLCDIIPIIVGNLNSEEPAQIWSNANKLIRERDLKQKLLMLKNVIELAKIHEYIKDYHIHERFIPEE